MVISTALIGAIGDCSSCVGIRVHSRTLVVVVAGVVIVCPAACDRIRGGAGAEGSMGTLRIRGLVRGGCAVPAVDSAGGARRVQADAGARQRIRVLRVLQLLVLGIMLPATPAAATACYAIASNCVTVMVVRVVTTIVVTATMGVISAVVVRVCIVRIRGYRVAAGGCRATAPPGLHTTAVTKQITLSSSTVVGGVHADVTVQVSTGTGLVAASSCCY
mmetsp:Transcript_35784/g.61557  ORF Transcript_35784/g.61557 Transcript_35784/m.61557 type:complete len:218 (-) Transcript_35784:154-807(-)